MIRGPEDEELQESKLGFYDSILIKEVTEGIFDWSSQHLLTVFELNCFARDKVVRMMERRRKKGLKIDDSDSDSSDGMEVGAVRDCDNCSHHGHNHNKPPPVQRSTELGGIAQPPSISL